MKKEPLNIPGLHGYLWTPSPKPDAVILVIHGMTEHAGRYHAFAESMCGQNIAVAAYDLRGHGVNAPTSDCAAMAPGDWEASIADIDRALAHLRSEFSCPLFLMGFSLGSFLVREYMQQPNPNMDGILLIGTGLQPKWLLRIMQMIVKTQIKKCGFAEPTPLVRQLSFGAYNQKFKPNRTESDWLCSDEQELQRYLADPLCRRDIAAGTFYELLCSMERTAHPRANGSVPILLLGGGQDPVGNFGKGTDDLWMRLETARYPVDSRIFPGARHMLLSEESGGQAQQAREYLISWLRSHI